MKSDIIGLPLKTNRLIPRAFAEADFPSYAAYHSRRDVYCFLYAQAPGGEALREQF